MLWRGRKARRALCFFALLFIIAAIGRLSALGALESNVTIRALTSIYSGPLTDWYWNGAVEADLDFRAERNPVVRAHLQLETTLLSNGLTLTADGGASIPANALPGLCTGATAVGLVCIDVPRANIRLRVPLTEEYRLRFTVGRARLTWGAGGVLFNAGDLLFGAAATQVDHTQTTLRDETAILVAAFIPITDFTFIEAVFLPPLSELLNAPIETGTAGLRVHGKIADWRYEIGYLYDGTQTAHNIALNLQGNVGADLYLSVASALVHNADLAGELYERLQITLGANYTVNVGNDVALTFRLESLWRPAAAWREQDGAAVRYALLLYPEVGVLVSNTIQVFLRSFFSPLDLSAQLIGGVIWRPYTGLSLLFFPTVNLGEAEDTFHFEQNGGIRFTVGAEYSF